LKSVELDEEVKPAACNQDSIIAELEAKHVALQDEIASKDRQF
jgi:hypothetical protein